MELAHDFLLKYRRTLRASAFAAIFTVGFCLVYAGLVQAHASGLSAVITNVSSTIHQSTTTTGATPTQAPITAVHSTSVQRCTSMHFGLPSALSLDNAPAGLSTQTDQPTEYQIYGNTANQLRDQLTQCGPGTTGSAGAEFTGQTDYNLNWQYDTTASANVCTLDNVKVGLHTSVALPFWQPTDNATNGLAGRWQTFSNGLRTHEEGHVAIDTSYATKLLSDLNALGPIPCDQVTAAVHAVTSADSAALNSANDAYDTSTNHGATQGAILPDW